MKAKYIETFFPRYFTLGTDSQTGNVGIWDANRDIATVTPDAASKLIGDRDRAIDMMIKLANALDDLDPKKFNETFYGWLDK